MNNKKNKHITAKIGFITGILLYIIVFYFFFFGSCMCGHGNFRGWKHWTMFDILSPLDEITLSEEEILKNQREKYGITKEQYENLINQYKD